MAESVDQLPNNRIDRVILAARGVLTAALFTAVVAAFANWIYELFFDPARYATGLPIARGLFVIVMTFPFILGGLVVLGIPTTWLLRRFHVANAFTFGLTGAVTGVLWGATVVALAVPTFGITAHVLNATFGVMSMLFWWWVSPKALATP
jgi:hypothetical protein